ncbi:hypothetical protein E2C01_066293 [Portunus trituberculatus]|uniref:Uncharacterized protein n=1 Tax=Portunus trituberculatus TaxID=210409 RepID=A0A5B7HGQ2_PORTR|nr:hypothetical protein [Portunus trituberculatus]
MLILYGGNVEKAGRGEVIRMRCRNGEVLGEVDPTVVQEAGSDLTLLLNRMGPREFNFGTVARLHETVTWRVHETVTWKVYETVMWKGMWRGGERCSKRRR